MSGTDEHTRGLHEDLRRLTHAVYAFGITALITIAAFAIAVLGGH